MIPLMTHGFHMPTPMWQVILLGILVLGGFWAIMELALLREFKGGKWQILATRIGCLIFGLSAAAGTFIVKVLELHPHGWENSTVFVITLFSGLGTMAMVAGFAIYNDGHSVREYNRRRDTQDDQSRRLNLHTGFVPDDSDSATSIGG